MFVTFEGPEGGGKSTAIASVAKRLREEGHPVLVTREPGAGEVGLRIREILLHGEGIPARSELFLFLADRSNHVETTIRPALERGEIVLCDRYADSTYVYQAIVRGLDAEFVAAANRFATSGLMPDATFLLDLPPAVGLGRIQNKDRIDQEPLAFHEKVREGFLNLARAEPSRWHVLDATLPSESVVTSFFEWFRRV